MGRIPFGYPSFLNYALYQAGWFACVLGAARGWPWSGCAIAAALVAIHLLWSVDRPRQVQRIVIAVAVGGLVEVIQIAAGTYRFTSGTVFTALPPPWLLLMWAQMATTFDFSMRPIVARPVAAALFGAVGGPLAFLAGERLGAVTLQRPLASSLVLLSISWAAAMILLAVTERRDGRRDPEIGIRRSRPDTP